MVILYFWKLHLIYLFTKYLQVEPTIFIIFTDLSILGIHAAVQSEPVQVLKYKHNAENKVRGTENICNVLLGNSDFVSIMPISKCKYEFKKQTQIEQAVQS